MYKFENLNYLWDDAKSDHDLSISMSNLTVNRPEIDGNSNDTSPTWNIGIWDELKTDSNVPIVMWDPNDNRDNNRTQKPPNVIKSTWTPDDCKYNGSNLKFYKITENQSHHNKIDPSNIWNIKNKEVEIFNQPKECAFCKTNNMYKSKHIDHTLKTANGIVTCPILRQYVCPLCKATGDNAHTIAYCPITKKKNGGRRPTPVTILLKSTKYKSNGKPRF